ncbi:MAG: hypothetical protein ACTSR0_00825 [Candidatus Asgardarchaeia archaeon]
MDKLLKMLLKIVVIVVFLSLSFQFLSIVFLSIVKMMISGNPLPLILSTSYFIYCHDRGISERILSSFILFFSMTITLSAYLSTYSILVSAIVLASMLQYNRLTFLFYKLKQFITRRRFNPFFSKDFVVIKGIWGYSVTRFFEVKDIKELVKFLIRTNLEESNTKDVNFSLEYSPITKNFIFSITVRGRKLKSVLRISEKIFDKISADSSLRLWGVEDPINLRYSFYTPTLYDLERNFIGDEEFRATAHFNRFPDKQNLSGYKHSIFLFRHVLREDLDEEIDEVLKKMEGLDDEKIKIKLLIAMGRGGAEKVLDEKERSIFKKILDLSREDSCIGILLTIKKVK